MSYAIGTVIYGTPVEIPDLDENDDQVEHDDPRLKKLGIVTLYSGSGLMPGYCGKKLNEIDECKDVNLTSLVANLKISDEDKRKVEEKVLALPSEYKAKKADFWIVWSSS